MRNDTHAVIANRRDIISFLKPDLKCVVLADLRIEEPENCIGLGFRYAYYVSRVACSHVR